MKDIDLLNSGYRYALSLNPNQADAEDIVHESWIRMNKKYGNQSNKSLFFTIIRNYFIDCYRRDKSRNEERLREDSEQAIIDFADESSFDVILDSDMKLALATLKLEERELLFLNIVDGESATQIANLTKTSRNTVLARISRAKEKLARILKNKTFESKSIENK